MCVLFYSFCDQNGETFSLSLIGCIFVIVLYAFLRYFEGFFVNFFYYCVLGVCGGGIGGRFSLALVF